MLHKIQHKHAKFHSTGNKNKTMRQIIKSYLYVFVLFVLVNCITRFSSFSSLFFSKPSHAQVNWFHKIRMSYSQEFTDTHDSFSTINSISNRNAFHCLLGQIKRSSKWFQLQTHNRDRETEISLSIQKYHYDPKYIHYHT